MRVTAARGFVWQGAQAVFNRGLSLVTFVVLARLLSPRDYGVVALANVFIIAFGLLSAAGFSTALVQRPTVDKKDLDTMFWIGLTVGLVLMVGISAAAWPLADAYGEPRLRPVLQALSTTFVFIALGSTPQAILQRRLAFPSLARATMLASIVATVVGIAFAATGLGVWALVVQTVLGVLVNSVAITVQSRYRPSLYVSLARFKPMFELSRNYLGSTLMNFLNTRLDDFLVGGTLGAAALGIYSVGYRLLVVMTDVLALSARGVAFPIFARLQDDPDRLRHSYWSATRMCAVVSVPVFLFVLVAAPQLVVLLFGERWRESVPVLQVLCLFGAQQAVMQFNDALLDATGRAKITFRVLMVGTALQVVAFLVTVQFGLVWVAASYVLRAYLMAPVGLWFAGRALDVPLARTLGSLGAPVVSALAMMLAAWGVSKLLGDTPGIAQLGGMLLTAVIVYPASLRAFGPTHFREAAAFIRVALTLRRVGRSIA